MYRGVNVLSLVPDRVGRGGTKFGYHSFQEQPINDTRQTLNVHVWQDSWRSDYAGFGGGAAKCYFPDVSSKDADSGVALALHGYTKYSTTDVSATPMTEMLGHNSVTVGGVPSGYIWNYSSYTDWTVLPGPVFSWNINTVCAASPTHPAVFTNIGNRCFIATGIGECMIYDSSAGLDVFGNGSGQPHTYPLGVGAPTAAPTIAPADVTNQTTGWVHIGSKYISDPDPNSGLGTIADPTADIEIRADGITWSGANRVTFYGKTTTFSTAGLSVSIANGSNIARFDTSGGGSLPTGGGWIMLTLTVNGRSFIMQAFGNMAPAETPALGVLEARLSDFYTQGTQNAADPPEWDPAYDINYQPFTVTGVRYTMKNTVSGLDVTWASGVYGVATPQATVINAGGQLTWDTTPPSYAYAWYDPITGHVSNISPIFAPTSTSVADSGVKINVDSGSSISYPPDPAITPSQKSGTNPFPRWTHILFFRTLMSGGSTLYPIGSLQPYITDPNDPTIVRDNPEWKGLPNPLAGLNSFPPVTTGNYLRDDTRDANLLVSGALRAPQFTNGKPSIIQNGAESILWPTTVAYWDGRLWMAAVQDPSAIHYSCDRTQCPFGIPEESFPGTNVLHIPAADGRICGMKLIGEHLLVTTERWAYTVAGNNESNYRLIRISTRMGGVGNYQMDEFVSDVEGGGAIVVFVGTDSKVYAMPLGGQATWISKEIQTYLDTAQLYFRRPYARVRVHCMNIMGRRMALVTIPNGSAGTNGKTFIYDFDQKVWTEHTIKNNDGTGNMGMNTAFATVPNDTQVTSEVYAMPWAASTPKTINVWQWFSQLYPTGMPSGYVRTFPLTFDDHKTRKEVKFVRIYVSQFPPASGGYESWRCTVAVDSATTYGPVAFVDELDDAYKMVGDYSVDTPGMGHGLGAKELIVPAPMLTGGPPLIGYTFDVTITFPDFSAQTYRLYKTQIGWATASDGQVDP